LLKRSALSHFLFLIFLISGVSELFAQDVDLASGMENALAASPSKAVLPCVVVGMFAVGLFLWLVYVVLLRLKVGIFAPRRYERVKWGISSAVLLLSVFYLLNVSLQVFILKVVAKAGAFRDFFQSAAGGSVAAFLAGFAAFTGAVVFIFLLLGYFGERPRKLGVSLERPGRNVLVGLAGEFMVYPLFFLAGVAVFYVARFFGRTPPPQEPIKIFMQLKEQGGAFFYSYIVFVVLIGPVCEELIFRGFIQNALRRYTGARGAVVASSLIFAVLHLNIYVALPIFFLGLFFLFFFEKTGNLLAPVSLHCLHNVLAISAAFFASPGAI